MAKKTKRGATRVKKAAASKAPKTAKLAKKAIAAVGTASAEKVPSAGDLKTLISQIKNAEKEKDEAVATVGGLISAAVEKKHFDKNALSKFRSLEKLSDRKLATTLTHLFHYIEVGGLEARASAQGDMVSRDQELAEAKIETIPTGKDKVKAAKKAATTSLVKAPAKGAVQEAVDRAEASSKKKNGLRVVEKVPVHDALEDDEPMVEYDPDAEIIDEAPPVAARPH